jgi:protein-S-isoprenylcysteine O-methyltransferase Ste14
MLNWTVIAAFTTFALLHSLTVSRVFKKFLSGIVGENRMRAYYRLFFTLFSAVTALAAFYIIWTQPDRLLYYPPQYISIPMRLFQVSGVVIFLFASKIISPGAFMGIRQAMNYLKTGETSGDIEGIENTGLVTSGVYGLVRHPMYLAGILVFLFEPVVTVNSLSLRVPATLYFLFGAFIEERRFRNDFGDSYAAYQREVPRLNIIAGMVRKMRRQ